MSIPYNIFKNNQFSLNSIEINRNKKLGHFFILIIFISIVILYLYSSIIKNTLPILLALDFIAVVFIIKFYKEISLKIIVIISIFTILVFISAVVKSGFGFFSYMISVSTFLCFLASILLLKKKIGVRISSYQMKSKQLTMSIIYGIIISIPFAILNIFFLNISTEKIIELKDPFYSLLAAIHPALYEEIVYRLLLINVSIYILYQRVTKKEMFFVILIIGTIPHAFLHVISTISIDPIFSLIKVITLFLFFGIIRVVFLWYRDIEMSMGFHWFMDVLRFIVGF
ncbi:MAG: hypothetical protein JXA99_13225 [Candidatus Lokiarchaeota archaeon]|nr:hypothetical protein [Candidatus Lokiarchaeota archaeon]